MSLQQFFDSTEGGWMHSINSLNHTGKIKHPSLQALAAELITARRAAHAQPEE